MSDKVRPLILVHGGAGNIATEYEADAREGCLKAAEAGYMVLRKTGDATRAVVEAVRVLEDNERFNAGRGAALTVEGQVELDTAVMRGSDLAFGAACMLERTKNPILLAQALLDSEFALLAGNGADAYAAKLGLMQVEPEYFVTARARERLAKFLNNPEGLHTGTVGAVAVDALGQCAAATSTGGRLGQIHGRIGDTPVPGAGTYASSWGAASGTGEGEYFMRTLAAYEAVQQARNASAQAGAEHAVQLVKLLGGSGGIIVVGADGSFGLHTNTPQMAWAHIGEDGEEAGVQVPSPYGG